ncbi:MAG: uL14 family ribosomal protein [Candidatus Riesia sp.]|nr:uL14 family ribosomal protein [Candidatus Riesia sp.]
MLFVQTIVRIADNSGGHFGLCLRIIGQNYRAAIGDAVVISIKSIILNRKITHQKKRKVLKGTVRRAIVIRNSFQKRRAFNIFIKGSSNAVAILGNWGLPLANRIYGPSYYELKISKYPKFATISEGAI